eukprot:5771228-Amphidinium_carterae.1
MALITYDLGRIQKVMFAKNSCVQFGSSESNLTNDKPNKKLPQQRSRAWQACQIPVSHKGHTLSYGHLSLQSQEFYRQFAASDSNRFSEMKFQRGCTTGIDKTNSTRNVLDCICQSFALAS